VRIRVKFGFCGAGLAACVGTLCLQPQPGPSQNVRALPETDQINTTESPRVQPGSPTLQQWEDQHQSTLAALERLNRSTDAALKRNHELLGEQVGQLGQSIAAQYEREFESLQRANQRAWTLMLAALALALGGVAALAVLQVRALNRLTGLLLAGPVAVAAQSLSMKMPDGATALISNHSGEPAADGFLLALDRLDRRLAEVEKINTARQIALENNQAAQAPSAGAKQLLKSNLPQPGKYSRIALTMGEGQALGFLPEEKRAGRPRRQIDLFLPLKKLFHFAGAKKAS